VKGLLVAVGLGERMTRPAWHSPRLLGPTLESPPVDQVIEAFGRAGFEEVAVIVGHSEDVLWHYLEDGSRYGMAVYCLHNSQYRRGTATAIYAARAFVGGEPFVVSLSGHPLTANMLLSVQGSARGVHAVCVDRHRRYDRESRKSTKVHLDTRGCVCRIGQRLAHWDAVSTGAFLFQPDVFKYISELLLHGKGDCSISALLRKMIACGEMPYACDVSPRWKGVLGSEDMLVWTAPMLSVRAVPEPLLA
jgi:dTDP-glucose pyrophosphorylase